MLLYHRPIPAKTPKRRSRAGCVHCKEKKKKCNEELPTCDRCTERGLTCEYEPVKPRKRRRTVSNPEHLGMRPPTTAPSNHRSSFQGRLQALRHDSSSGSSMFSASPTPPLPSIAEKPSFPDSWEVQSAFSDSGSSVTSDVFHAYDSPIPTFHGFDHMPLGAPGIEGMGPIQMDPMDGYPKELHHEGRVSAAEMYMSHGVPTSSPYMDQHPMMSRSNSYPDPSTTFLSPVSSGSPLSRPNSGAYLDPPSSRISPYPDPTSTLLSNNPGASTYDRALPAFHEFTNSEARRGLLSHFCNVLIPLIIFKEDSTNPFRSLILPMALKSKPLLSAIYAISSAHLEHRGIQLEERALDLQSKSLQGLAQLIAHKDEGNRNEILAVIILLLYYEIIGSGSSTVLHNHLKGALSIMREKRVKRGPMNAFLERAFRYFDLTSALSFATPPMSGTLFTPTNLEFNPSLPHTTLSNVDPIFGLFADLWPILHRLATLISTKRILEDQPVATPSGTPTPTTLLQDFETSTSSLELLLQQWMPRAPLPDLSPHCSVDSATDDSNLQSILNNAEAYKQASFVFLYRTLLSHPRTSAKVQQPMKLCLQVCLRVVIFAGPMAALLWPLFVASCEAVEEVDRSVARTVFRALEARQGMRNIVTAWEVCEEVWRRSDEGREAEWRGVAAEMGREVIFG